MAWFLNKMFKKKPQTSAYDGPQLPAATTSTEDSSASTFSSSSTSVPETTEGFEGSAELRDGIYQDVPGKQLPDTSNSMNDPGMESGNGSTNGPASGFSNDPSELPIKNGEDGQQIGLIDDANKPPTKESATEATEGPGDNLENGFPSQHEGDPINQPQESIDKSPQSSEPIPSIGEPSGINNGNPSDNQVNQDPGNVKLGDKEPAKEIVDTPVKDSPADALPVEDSPLQTPPIEEAPVKELPFEDFPKEDVPLEGIPLDDLPDEDLPNEGLPLEDLPHEDLPDEDLIDEDLPEEGFSEEDLSDEYLHDEDEDSHDEELEDEDLHDQDSHDEDLYDEDSSDEDLAVKDLPAEKWPVKELPVDELPLEEYPVETLPAEDIPVEKLPIEEPSVEELPADEESDFDYLEESHSDSTKEPAADKVIEQPYDETLIETPVDTMPSETAAMEEPTESFIKPTSLPATSKKNKKKQAKKQRHPKSPNTSGASKFSTRQIDSPITLSSGKSISTSISKAPPTYKSRGKSSGNKDGHSVHDGLEDSGHKDTSSSVETDRNRESIEETQKSEPQSPTDSNLEPEESKDLKDVQSPDSNRDDDNHESHSDRLNRKKPAKEHHKSFRQKLFDKMKKIGGRKQKKKNLLVEQGIYMKAWCDISLLTLLDYFDRMLVDDTEVNGMVSGGAAMVVCWIPLMVIFSCMSFLDPSPFVFFLLAGVATAYVRFFLPELAGNA